MYGMGNSRMTDYDERDLELAKAMADLYNLPFQRVDWSGNQPHSPEELEKLFRTHGFKFEIYGSSDSFLRSFDGGLSPYPDLLLGGRGPAFMNSKPWELNPTTFRFEDLVNDGMQYAGGNVAMTQGITCKAEYRSVLAAEIKTGLDRAGIDFPDTGASLETFVKAKLFLYIRPEARFLNLANEFGHYIEPFLLKRLHDPLLSMPFKFRAKDEFQLRLIHALSPGLLELPLYSGLRPARIDRTKFHFVRDQPKSNSSLFRSMARVALPDALKKSARSIYRRLGLAKKSAAVNINCISGRDAQIVEAYNRQVMDDPLGSRWFSSTSELTPKTLTRIRLYLLGVNTLGYSE